VCPTQAISFPPEPELISHASNEGQLSTSLRPDVFALTSTTHTTLSGVQRPLRRPDAFRAFWPFFEKMDISLSPLRVVVLRPLITPVKRKAFSCGLKPFPTENPMCVPPSVNEGLSLRILYTLPPPARFLLTRSHHPNGVHAPLGLGAKFLMAFEPDFFSPFLLCFNSWLCPVRGPDIHPFSIRRLVMSNLPSVQQFPGVLLRRVSRSFRRQLRMPRCCRPSNFPPDTFMHIGFPSCLPRKIRGRP